jgi:hypothetical protein
MRVPEVKVCGCGCQQEFSSIYKYKIYINISHRNHARNRRHMKPGPPWYLTPEEKAARRRAGVCTYLRACTERAGPGDQMCPAHRAQDRLRHTKEGRRVKWALTVLRTAGMLAGRGRG